MTNNLIIMANWYCTLSSTFRTEIITSEKSYKAIAEKCDLLSKWLDILKKKCPKHTIIMHENGCSEEEYNKHYHWLQILESIESLKDNTQFAKDLATGTISADEWDDFGFDGDMVGEFNNLLSCFYDICDTYVGEATKFCFIQLD